MAWQLKLAITALFVALISMLVYALWSYTDRTNIDGGQHCEGTTLVQKVIVLDNNGDFLFSRREYQPNAKECAR